MMSFLQMATKDGAFLAHDTRGGVHDVSSCGGCSHYPRNGGT